jgi:hypothetical protein
MHSKIPAFKYSFLSGPVESPELLSKKEGNCRSLLQWFFWVSNKQFFPPKALLNPAAYRRTGEFISLSDPTNFFSNLPDRVVIFAERKRANTTGFDKEEDKYLISLHTAVYLQSLTEIEKYLSKGIKVTEIDASQPVILHATSTAGGVVVWEIDKFLEFYRPVAAKKFI